ncbi:MAG: endonuclease Q family protein [Candidatus Falkowbacteria bacterium]
MQYIADFHIHSRFSRACSKELTLANLDATCRIKGVQIIGTGDMTHPEWFREIRSELVETEDLSGLYRHRDALDNQVLFTLTTELALIYKDEERVRRLHLVVHAPNIEAASELNRQLGERFNLKSDGRPILGVSAPDLVKLCLKIHPQFLIYPAHIWTPWFSVFGSKSGFNSMEACFKDQAKFIYAYETGLSSDPAMNWRVSQLDKLSLLSSSDAHSLPNIAREATVFDLSNCPTYAEIFEVIKNCDWSKIIKTLEFYPEEGMYHFDGHRDCSVSFEPKQTMKLGGICPVCKKPLIIGVANRAEELADRPDGYHLKGAPGFVKLIELDKIIAEACGVKSRTSVKVRLMYDTLIKTLGSELDILMHCSIEAIAQVAGERVAEGVRRVRTGEISIVPGFDGQYGRISIFKQSTTNNVRGQNKLL